MDRHNADRQAYRQTGLQTDRHEDRQAYRQTGMKTDRHTDRPKQNNRRVDGHSVRQTDRLANRQCQRDRQAHRQCQRD